MASTTVWTCGKCGKSLPRVRLWPVRCSCGHVDRGTPQQHNCAILSDILKKERLVACHCCPAYHNDRCDKIDAGCSRVFAKYIKDPNRRCPLNRWDKWDIEFITYEHLVRTTLSLIGECGSDIDAVIGIPRSGLLPASIMATAMHLPLYTAYKKGLNSCGGGFRSPHIEPGDMRRAILVDDSMSTGKKMQLAIETLSKKLECTFVTAVLFANPDAKFTPDLVGQWLKSPHWFEWNLFNANTATVVALDMDGVICEDIPREKLGDKEEGLRNARPLSVPQFLPVRAIISTRLESHRTTTTQWLKHHKAKYNTLVLGPWASRSERTRAGVVEYKSLEYARSGAKLFIESSDWLSKQIAHKTQKPVLCWTNKKLYTPQRPRNPRLVFLSPVFRIGGVELWITQICEAAKDKWDCVIAVPHHNNCSNMAIKAAQEHASIVTGKSLCADVCTDADLVVTWGGVGTLDAVLRREKPTIFMSRLAGPAGDFHSRGWKDNPNIIHVAISQMAAEVLNNSSATIIPLGVDPRRLRYRARRKDTSFTVGYVGRYSHAKNYIMAARVGRKMGCRVIYLGAGDSHQTDLIKSVCPSATVLRTTLEPGNAYHEIDVFIQASPCETGPITTLEAMFCGTRVVSTPVGILLDMEQKHGQLAHRVPIDPEVGQVVAAVELAREDDETWSRAKHIVCEQYLMEHRIPQWLGLFENACEVT